MTIVLLHGFLGSPSDWDAVVAGLRTKLQAKPGEAVDVVVPDLAVVATRSEIVDFYSFATWLNENLRARSDARGMVIAGYSLGGRLAAHAVLASDSPFQKAVLISSHPGMEDIDIQGRHQRLQNDLAWIDRFKDRPWVETWAAWNAQAVLRPGSRSLSVREPSIDSAGAAERKREAWARAMGLWSVALQRDLRQPLIDWMAAAPGREIVAMTGTEDAKFTEITSNWLSGQTSAIQGLRHRTVLGVGHRILLEAPDEIVSEILRLLA